MVTQYWTSQEVEYLKKQYGKVDTKMLSQEIGHTPASIRTKASSLGLVGKSRAWSSADVEFLRENYLELGAQETADRIGRSIGSVHSKIREIGGGRDSIGPRVDWTQEELDYLAENYQTQAAIQIACHLGRTESAVQIRASMIGLPRYIEPFPFFENWTEQNAYVVGFFAADGWVSKRGPESIRIGFGQKEPDIIYKLKEMIGSGRVSRNSKGMYRFWIQSVKVYEWLCEIFGRDVCRKSNTLQWPKVPDEFVRHFLRGAFDGDGSLSKRNDGLWTMGYTTNSKDFIDALALVIGEMTGIKLSVGVSKIGSWFARTTGIGAVCLADWLYRDSTVALERKAWIAREMMAARGIAHKEGITPKMYEMFPHILNEYQIV